MNHFISNFDIEAEASLGVLDDRTIGRILVDHGKLKREDVDRVFRLHKEKGMRFGEAAQKLKLITKADIQQALAVQFNYPCLQPGEAILGAELVAAYQPSSPQGEAVRDLRSQLLFRWFDSRQKTLSIVSPKRGDGRSYIAANLAVAFSQWGGNTLLIDADLRAPRQHQIFSLPGQVGLSSVLSGRAWTEVIQPIPYFGNLSILPAGTVPPNPLELLGRQEFVRLLSDAARNYEFVLIDTPASEKGSDAVTIAARTGGAMMVARQDHSRLPELQELMDGVTGYGAQLVGTILNEF
ncbi:MAG TPA: chain length determinant protein tyrosine kinase EpsG [Burkholderiales bacterium]|nr:chain length determinant protein tyrosine kinase EpsG [Burkholderiales bacterium]